MGVRPQAHYQRWLPAPAGHPEPTVPISAGTTVSSRREFPGARPACRGTPKPMWIGWVFGSGEPKNSAQNSLGVRGEPMCRARIVWGVRFGRTEV